MHHDQLIEFFFLSWSLIKSYIVRSLHVVLIYLDVLGGTCLVLEVLAVCSPVDIIEVNGTRFVVLKQYIWKKLTTVSLLQKSLHMIIHRGLCAALWLLVFYKLSESIVSLYLREDIYTTDISRTRQIPPKQYKILINSATGKRKHMYFNWGELSLLAVMIITLCVRRMIYELQLYKKKKTVSQEGRKKHYQRIAWEEVIV